MSRILTENYKRALHIIETNKDKLENLAQTLMRVETLDREGFEELMNSDPADSSEEPEPEPVT